ncbi:hypothetical protein B0T44_02780 [Nocardia donostiensis]|uniref:Metallo-beta-lactamase domain-containing protein n=2 Tax=Nocardia donostiensis TaxID=1538463 RepID=A0A1V2TAN2_9NOCA|nr:hypothetical protein B0T46_22545 [Nocardia donostiensis]OQS23199.1 hypothetical protein B0T44_02780 [Nocardia donostiensis]
MVRSSAPAVAGSRAELSENGWVGTGMRGDWFSSLRSGRDEREAAAGAGDSVIDARLLPAASACWLVTIAVLTAGWMVGIAVAIGLTVAAIGLWGLLLTVLAHRYERSRAVVSVLLAAVVLSAGFAVAAAWRDHQVAQHPLRAVPEAASVRVVVTPVDDPKPVRGNSFGGQQRWVIRAGLREFQHAANAVSAGGAVVILAEGSEWAVLPPGQPIEFRARPSAPLHADLTVATLRALGPPDPAGALPWWQHAAGSVRADLAAAAQRALSPDAAGLLPALVVGDTAALPDQVREDFTLAGLQHLHVVSGANFTVLLSAVLFVTRLLTLGPRLSAVCAAGALVMFVIVARPDPSVLRAAAMGAITLLALLTGRRKQALPALCAAVIGLIAIWPALAVQAGFALSVLATGALILLAPSWADWLRARGWWRLPAELVAVSAAAFVITAPLLVALTGTLSVVAVAANVLVAPVVAPITVLGATGAVLACLWIPLAELVLRCTAPPLWWLLSVAERAAAIPGATVVVPGGTSGGLIAALLVGLGIVALRSALVRRLSAAVLLGVAAVVVPLRVWSPGWPPDGWVVAACDVGQGDGLALSVGDRSAVVIDVGPEPRRIRTCLDRLRIEHIPLLILTHPHADHIGGVTGALQGRTVSVVAVAPNELPAGADAGSGSRTGRGVREPFGRHLPPASGEPRGAARPIIDAETAETSSATAAGCPPSHSGRPSGQPTNSGPDTSECADLSSGDGPDADDGPGSMRADRASGDGPDAVASILAAAHIPVLELVAGDQLRFGSVTLEVLAPGSADAAVGEHSVADANNRSLVVAVDTAAGRVLLTGDTEAPVQRSLLRAPERIRADILKVPHHGSRTTAPEFLSAVRPRLAIVSAGSDNTFGHPHPAVLAELEAMGTTVARTDRHGDIAVVPRGSGLNVHTARPFGATRRPPGLQPTQLSSRMLLRPKAACSSRSVCGSPAAHRGIAAENIELLGSAPDHRLVHELQPADISPLAVTFTARLAVFHDRDRRRRTGKPPHGTPPPWPSADAPSGTAPGNGRHRPAALERCCGASDHPDRTSDLWA